MNTMTQEISKSSLIEQIHTHIAQVNREPNGNAVAVTELTGALKLNITQQGIGSHVVIRSNTRTGAKSILKAVKSYVTVSYDREVTQGELSA